MTVAFFHELQIDDAADRIRSSPTISPKRITAIGFEIRTKLEACTITAEDALRLHAALEERVAVAGGGERGRLRRMWLAEASGRLQQAIGMYKWRRERGRKPSDGSDDPQ